MESTLPPTPVSKFFLLFARIVVDFFPFHHQYLIAINFFFSSLIVYSLTYIHIFKNPSRTHTKKEKNSDKKNTLCGSCRCCSSVHQSFFVYYITKKTHTQEYYILIFFESLFYIKIKNGMIYY